MCGICGRTFTLAASLTRHMYDHQELQYKCEHCAEAFHFESELRAHKVSFKEIKCILQYHAGPFITQHAKLIQTFWPYSCAVIDIILVTSFIPVLSLDTHPPTTY